MTHFLVSWSLLSPQVAFRALKTHHGKFRNKMRNIISVMVVASLFLIQLLKDVMKGITVRCLMLYASVGQ
jgi:cell division protein FtsB